MGRLKYLLVVFGVLSLTACIPNKEFDRQAASGLHSIVISGPDDPTHYGTTIDNINLASIYNTSDTSVHEDLNAKLMAMHFHLGQDIQASLSKEISAQGYQITIKNIAHKDGELPTTAQIASAGTDAVLASTITVAGYASAITTNGLTPIVVIEVHLLDAKSGNVLFERRYIYTSETFSPRVKLLPVNARYSFSSNDALIANPKLAAEGLSAVGPLVAQDVAAALRK